MSALGMFRDLAGERFVSLTTFRRSGTPVATTVNVAADDDALIVATSAASGKVKRLRHTTRVELRPATARGEVTPDAPTFTGRASVLEDAASIDRLNAAMVAKYGWVYRLLAVRDFFLRFRNPEAARHVMIRIEPAQPGGLDR